MCAHVCVLVYANAAVILGSLLYSLTFMKVISGVYNLCTNKIMPQQFADEPNLVPPYRKTK